MAKDKLKGPSKRTLARLFAVQGLYLLRMNPDASPEDIVQDLRQLSVGAAEDYPSPAGADQVLLQDIIKGTTGREDEIKSVLKKVLIKKWSYDRLETLLQVILSAGVYELIARPDIPVAVIIDEYINLGHAYYEGDEPKFINGILEEVAKSVRAKADG